MNPKDVDCSLNKHPDFGMYTVVAGEESWEIIDTSRKPFANTLNPYDMTTGEWMSLINMSIQDPGMRELLDQLVMLWRMKKA